jgi:hypothetical protein
LTFVNRILTTAPHCSWRLDVVLLLIVTAVAAVPRLALLGDIPPGLHGDEAIAGLEARRILDGENIGPYSFQALGVPAGTFYWTAGVFAVLGESAVTLRLAFALLGIAGVTVSYLAFRVMFTRTVAFLSALLLALSAWHLHYSRVAFIPIGWPLAEMATLLLFFLALRRRSRILFALAGLALGAGVYTYQAFPVFAVALGIVVLWLAVFHYRRDLVRFTAQIATMLGIALMVGLSMASFARDHPDVFLGRYRNYSVTKTPEYKAADNLIERGRYIAARELDYIRSVISRPVVDGVDAAGVFPLVDRVTLGLLIVGGGIALWRLRSPPYIAVIILTVIIGLGPALASEGSYRRTLGLTPLLAAVAAMPLALLWDEARKYGIRSTALATLVVALTIGSIGAINLSRYFSSYDDDPSVRWVYAADMAETSRYVAKLPEDTYVYFYYDRASFNYETRRFLAPEAQGEDRSAEFGRDGFRLDHGRPQDVAYIFMGSYLDQAPNVEELYPGGRRYTALDSRGTVIFESYVLSRSDETGVATPGAVPGESLTGR